MIDLEITDGVAFITLNAPATRKATASLRAELGPPRLPWAAALEVERGAQLWSLRRRVSQ